MLCSLNRNFLRMANVLAESQGLPPLSGEEEEVVEGFHGGEVADRWIKSRKVSSSKEGRMLGAGQFGEVYKAVDMESGMLMNVEMLKPPPAASEERRKFYIGLKREVEHFSRISHVRETSSELSFG
ncbi:hypothetical protein DTO271G3_1197 [Paecilomyces variotii]|nr:hypothetical protein DTO271G3_1197 [Paecilomyces variotii]